MPQLLTSATNVNCQASRVESLKNALHSLIFVCKRMSLKQWGKIVFEGEFSFFRNCNFKRFVRNTHARVIQTLKKYVLKMQVQKYVIASSEELSPQCES